MRHRIDGFPVEIIQPEKLQPTEYPDRAAFEDALRELFGRQATRSLVAVARLRKLEREVG